MLPSASPRPAFGLLALVGFLALTVRRSLVEVRGPSMEPSLWGGDHLITVPTRPWMLRAGQVVVLLDPQDASHRVIKRIAAIGADGVTVHGDDPRRSTDSRHFGPVPASSIRRIAVARWPDLRSPLTHRPGATENGERGGRVGPQPARRASTSTSGSSRPTSPSARHP